MWDLVGNPEDRFSHNEAHMAVTSNDASAWRIEIVLIWASLIFESRCEKTGLRGFRPGPTQTGLYSHRRRLEA